MQEAFLVASKLLPVLVFPLSIAFVLLAVSLGPRLGPRTRRALVASALGILLVFSCGPVAKELGRCLEWRYLPLAEVPEADAIVLLGGVVAPALYPRRTAELYDGADRIVEAARLFRAGRAPRILLSGGSFHGGRPESDDLASYLRELGVPDAALLADPASRNTFENAVEARRRLAPLGANRILLVTSALHMPRAVGLFRHQGFDVVPVPVDFSITAELPSERGAWFWWAERLPPNVDSLAYSTRVIREYLGILVYRMRGLID